MERFLSHVKNGTLAKNVHILYFETKLAKFAILINKMGWYICSLHVCFSLKVPKKSTLYDAIISNKIVPWQYTYKLIEDEAIVFESVAMYAQSQHFSSDKAYSQAILLQEQCKAGIYPKDFTYPRYYKYFEQFESIDKTKFIKRLRDAAFTKEDIVPWESTNLDDKPNHSFQNTINKTCFDNKIPSKHLKTDTILMTSYFQCRLFIIQSEIFYSEENLHHFDNSCILGTHTKVIMQYEKIYQLYLMRDNDEYRLIQKSNHLQLDFLHALYRREWELIFEPLTFCDSFTQRIHHRNLMVEKLVDANSCEIAFGSILRVNKANGIYLHAGVYLGQGSVIHVDISKKARAGKQKKKIFSFIDLTDFINKEAEFEEIRFIIPRFSEEELKLRALYMTRQEAVYDLVKNNCEHFAFSLTTGLDFSLQMMVPFKKVMCKLLESLN
jgi:hypothetical protein